MIELRGFRVSYRSTGVAALDGIDLQLAKGQCLLIAGSTGCGKTTLLRSLAGLLHREGGVSISGKAFVNGMALDRVNRSEFAPRVGILFQNPDDQITGHTPREEISFGLENLGFDADKVHQHVEAALADVELSERADHPIDTLSGGQKQRVAAAAVIAMHPDLLLLDEPVSNLDWRGRKRLTDLLARLKARGMTIVICSHETEALKSIADSAARMENGRISKIGGVDILEKPSVVVGARYGSKNGEVPLIQLTGVKRTFGREGFSLGPLEFAVKRGEIVALIGPNGGGKTTLISLLAGILKPDSGSIRYLGNRLRRFDRRLLRRIGYIAQNPDLMLHHGTVIKELESRPRNLGMKLNFESASEGMLNQYGLAEFGLRHPFSLSQGQRQRLALAAATAGGADLVLIDEPTTGQDSEQISAIQTRLTELAANGAAIIFSTHNIHAAAECATRVIVLVDGDVLFDGPFHSFINNREMLANLDFDTPEVLP